MNQVIIPIAPGFEEIEAITIIDLLRRASISVTTAGLEENYVSGSHQISIKCDIYYQDVFIEEYDYLILPGGQPATNHLKANRKILEWLDYFNKTGKIIAAICAAPSVLLAAGVIGNKKITSYPSEKHLFNPDIYSEENVVHDGNIVTSRGVGTAIDFALYLVNQIKGKETANELAQRILFSSC